MIDLRPDQLERVQTILAQHVPQAEVRAFGSRVTWTAKEYSDLDVVIVGREKMSRKTLNRLQEAFANSDLPFRVDVLDWHRISDSFKQIIEEAHELVQEPKQQKTKWDTFKIKDIGRVVTGRTPPTSNSEYFNGEVPFITPTDMDGRRVINETQRYLSKAGVELLSRIIIPKGVAVSCIGWQMGKSVLIQRPSITNQQINSIIPDESIIDNLFLYYVMSSKREEIFRFGSGATRTPIVKKSDFENFVIPLPPLSEQRAIAHILNSFDDKIELNRQMNQTLEAMAQAIFEAWFVNFEPVRAKQNGQSPAGMNAATAALFPDRLVESKLGPVPEEWQVKPLDEIANFLNGLALQKYPPEDEDYLPVLKIRELRQGGSDEKSNQASVNIPEAYVIKNGDVIFSWSGSLLIDIWCGGEAALNQHLFKVTSDNYPKWFYYLWTQYHLADFQRIAAGKATTMGHIKRRHLSEALTVVPPGNFLREAEQIIEPIIESIINYRLQSRALIEMRDTLLPGLVSGLISIHKTEEFVEEAL